jgi:hypothetical protein
VEIGDQGDTSLAGDSGRSDDEPDGFFDQDLA